MKNIFAKNIEQAYDIVRYVLNGTGTREAIIDHIGQVFFDEFCIRGIIHQAFFLEKNEISVEERYEFTSKELWELDLDKSPSLIDKYKGNIITNALINR